MNSTYVSTDRAVINLHSLWDGLILGSDRYQAVSNEAIELRNRPEFARENLTELADVDPEHWAKESVKVATETAYRNGTLLGSQVKTDAPVRPDRYVDAAKAAAERRIVLAGYRLGDSLLSEAATTRAATQPATLNHNDSIRRFGHSRSDHQLMITQHGRNNAGSVLMRSRSTVEQIFTARQGGRMWEAGSAEGMCLFATASPWPGVADGGQTADALNQRRTLRPYLRAVIRTPVTAQDLGLGVSYMKVPAVAALHRDGTAISNSDAEDAAVQMNRATPPMLARSLSVPHWMVAAALAMGPAIWFAGLGGRRLVRKHRRKLGRCTVCGYDLQATPIHPSRCSSRASPARFSRPLPFFWHASS